MFITLCVAITFRYQIDTEQIVMKIKYFNLL